jgi:hypothetical protein
MQKLAFILVAVAACQAQYRPLEIADGCACSPSEYCRVSAPSAGLSARVDCEPLPATCALHPTCDCVGTPNDACRDYDGHLTLLPARAVATCDACSGEELCLEGTSPSPVCRLFPPRCESSPTCDCVLESRNAANLACAERRGRVVATLKR